jgi:putative transposase
MRKTFRYRLFPTPAQRIALQKQLDCCRWVYNKTLEVRRDTWQQQQTLLTRYDTNKLLTLWKQENPWLQNGHAQIMQEAQKRVDLAFRAFFQRIKRGEKAGYPRFHSYERYDSFTYPQEKSNWRFLDNECLRLSKVGDVKIKVHRALEGECKTLTIRRDAVGNWYACFSCIVETRPLPPTDKVTGIDLGLSVFATLSNGERIARQRWMKRDENDIARLQRKKEHFAQGSPQRRQVIQALCHAYQRAANRRKNFAHQESRKLVNEYQFIAFEELDIAEMQVTGNKVIRRNLADVAWSQFVAFTAYKAECAGRGVVLVDPKGTTQSCSGCGEMVPKELSVRVHLCPHCGLNLNRDQNAALNILARGLAGMGSIPKSSLIFEEA